MFQGLAWHFHLIFGLWTSRNCDLSELKKATFLVVASRCELIFCLLTSTKFDLDDIENRYCKLSIGTLKSFYAS